MIKTSFEIRCTISWLRSATVKHDHDPTFTPSQTQPVDSQVHSNSTLIPCACQAGVQAQKDTN
jgi:hypothetical protein